jgi:hypothetical protein|tara:strand:+ start:3249 stop:3956 length:708 start_codon:yes stop_codon:yes gene_type:complete
MFALRITEPIDFYDYCYSEYLIEKYPKNYFAFGFDIGACGINSKWHINHMGNDNPNTIMIGFEPDTQGFNLIKKECASLPNVHVYKEFFGRTRNLQQLINEHNLDITKTWMFSCDCEGDEKYLFTNKANLDILKTASHIAFEIHPKFCDISYVQFIKYFKDHFGDTHKIIRTFHGDYYPNGHHAGTHSFILVKFSLYETVIKDVIKNFKYNWNSNKDHARLDGRDRPEHSIKFFN